MYFTYLRCCYEVFILMLIMLHVDPHAACQSEALIKIMSALQGQNTEAHV